jgi:hypothetical protein
MKMTRLHVNGVPESDFKKGLDDRRKPLWVGDKAAIGEGFAKSLTRSKDTLPADTPGGVVASAAERP